MKKTKIMKRYTFIIALLLAIPAAFLNAAGQPSLVWQNKYVFDKHNLDLPSVDANHFVIDPTDSNRILHIAVCQSHHFFGTSSSMWYMKLLDAHTGQFVGDPITINSLTAHKDPHIKWFFGLGANCRTLTYHLESNNILNFICATSVIGYSYISAHFPAWLQTFRTEISNDGLKLLYNPNGTIFPDTVLYNAPFSLLLSKSYFAYRHTDDALYYKEGFGLMLRTFASDKNEFVICRIDTMALDTFQKDINPYRSFKRDTIGINYLFEDAGFDTTNKQISEELRNVRRFIDIDDTLSVIIFDIVDADCTGNDCYYSQGFVMLHYNSVTGVFYDKIFYPWSFKTYRNNYNFDYTNNMFYAINRNLSTSDLIIDRLVFYPEENIFKPPYFPNVTFCVINYGNTPLQSGKNFYGRPNRYYIHDDSTLYIYGSLTETGTNNPKVYLAKYDMSDYSGKLLWEDAWESSDTLLDISIFFHNNDIYLYGYNERNNLRVEYFKLTDTTTSIEDSDNIFSNGNSIFIYPNPTSEASTILLELETSGNVKIVLSDVLGQELLQIYDGFATAGTFSKTFTTENLSRGVYFLKILSGKNFTVEKIVVN